MLVGRGWAFIHIPKCGGTTVRGVLEGREVSEWLPMVPRHTVSHRFHWLAHSRPPGEVFTFVRRPHRWLLSYWCMRSKEERKAWRVLDALWSDDHDEFMQSVATKEPGYIGQMYDAYMPYPGIKVHTLEGRKMAGVLRTYAGREVVIEPKNKGFPPPISDESIAAINESEAALLAKFYP